jgi:hypothetical protein
MSDPIPWVKVRHLHTYEIQQITSLRMQDRVGAPFVRRMHLDKGEVSFGPQEVFVTDEISSDGVPYSMRRLCCNYVVLRELIPEP